MVPLVLPTRLVSSPSPLPWIPTLPCLTRVSVPCAALWFPLDRLRVTVYLTLLYMVRELCVGVNTM